MLKNHPIRGFLLSIFLAGSVLTLQAQQRYSMSAAEAQDYALKHVAELKNLKIDREMQDAKNREITGQALPQLNGNVTTSRFFEIPVTLLPDFVTPQV
jgi:outer membrane protein